MRSGSLLGFALKTTFCALAIALPAARADTFTNLALAIRVAGPAQVEVSWDTATNAGYRLEYCSTLMTNAARATNRINVTVTP